MKILSNIAVTLLLAVVVSAQTETSKPGGPKTYSVQSLGTLGAGPDRGNGINNDGWITGYSTNANGIRRAALWADGDAPVDLGSLGGTNGYSSVVWPVKGTNGMIVGITQTSTTDPNGENWSCSPFLYGTASNITGKTCVGFFWEDGQMRALPTLGGPNGFATGVNNRGQIVGWAENSVRDSRCVAPQVLQFRPVLWEPRRNRTTALPLIYGDSSGAATAINNRGQAVGISGICDQAVGRYTAAHAVFWDRGRAYEIVGDNGGPYWDTPMAINNRGDVVGFVGRDGDVDGNQLRAFFWSKRKGFRYLQPLPGFEGYSEARGINNRGQIVGISCTVGAAACRAVLWRNYRSPAVDLDTLAPGYDGTINTAQDIDDDGQITGRATTAAGIRVAFLATPDDEDDD